MNTYREDSDAPWLRQSDLIPLGKQLEKPLDEAHKLCGFLWAILRKTKMWKNGMSPRIYVRKSKSTKTFWTFWTKVLSKFLSCIGCRFFSTEPCSPIHLILVNTFGYWLLLASLNELEFWRFALQLMSEDAPRWSTKFERHIKSIQAYILRQATRLKSVKMLFTFAHKYQVQRWSQFCIKAYWFFTIMLHCFHASNSPHSETSYIQSLRPPSRIQNIICSQHISPAFRICCWGTN